MVEPQPSKLMMRVRFPSAALSPPPGGLRGSTFAPLAAEEERHREPEGFSGTFIPTNTGKHQGRGKEKQMSTVVIIAIVVAALILAAIVVSIARRTKAKREIGHAQVEAQHDDVRHHRDQAEQKRSEAALSAERAKRAEAEAELNEKRAGEREQELEGQN
jgi:uncharacterized low-complexity protein